MSLSLPLPEPRRSRLSQDARVWLQWAGPGGLSLLLATVAAVIGLRGTDVAMQTYRVELLRLHGFVVWDSGWYGGDFPLSYSVLSPALGALMGVAGASVLSAAAASWFFDRVVRRATGHRSLGSWYFGASTVLAVSIGQLPYLSGEAVALAAVLALLNGRARLGVALGLVSALFSPLAAAFLILALAVWALHDRTLRRPMVATAVATGAVVIGIGVLFPGDGPFPFHWAGLVIVELLCLLVLSPVVRTIPAVRLAAAVYGLATLGSFLVPNPLGGNATRLAESVGVPLVACLMTMPAPIGGRRKTRPADRPEVAAATATATATASKLALVSAAARAAITAQLASARAGARSRSPFGRRPLLRRPALALGLFLPFAVWQWAPGTGVVAAAAPTPSDTASFYAPLLRELAHEDEDRPVRLEVVPTRDHWESAYIGPYVSLARGWERQLDVADDPIFYIKGQLTGSSYRTWLNANGVSYVALAVAPLDYAGVGEAALLRTRQVSGLRLVWRSAGWQLWQVRQSPGLVTGAARLVTLAPDRLVFDVQRPGDFLVRVRYISYWHLTTGQACVQAAPGDWTEVHATAAGTVQLNAKLVGGNSAVCRSS
jgi:hypothetical protein